MFQIQIQPHNLSLLFHFRPLLLFFSPAPNVELFLCFPVNLICFPVIFTNEQFMLFKLLANKWYYTAIVIPKPCALDGIPM